MASYEIAEYRPKSFPHGDDYIVVLVTPGWLGRFFGRCPEEEAFKGRGTVWRTYPNGDRAGAAWEARITALIAQEEMRLNPVPAEVASEPPPPMKFYCPLCGYVGDTGPMHNLPHAPMTCAGRAEQQLEEEIFSAVADDLQAQAEIEYRKANPNWPD
jgi:hypothetical protein